MAAMVRRRVKFMTWMSVGFMRWMRGVAELVRKVEKNSEPRFRHGWDEKQRARMEILARWIEV